MSRLEMKMKQSRRVARGRGDRGAILVMFALLLVVLLTFAGICVDGGRAYGLNRQMQNAADAAAMAGGRALDQYQTGGGSFPVTSVYTAARDQAATDGASVASGNFTCTLFDFTRTINLGPCPMSSAGSIDTRAAAGKVTVTQTENTLIARVAGMSTYTANSDATSLIGKPTGGNGPFLMCANALGAVPNILVNVGTETNPVWQVNPAAQWPDNPNDYALWGNDIKLQGRDCGDPAGNFRGLIDQSAGPYSIPGWWETDNGNKNGPTLQMISSGAYCDSNYVVGCKLVLPLCTKGNGASGNSFQVYCVDLGLFEITSSNNHDIRGRFLGGATVAQGGIGGEADANGSRIVQLVE